eukprot:TRINITY_DN32433_c0_g1_i1.p1 TRINITY_DN32433_c0_g1~~TRINITY_DN32433_c0_g1_i1.p1  ORF type:complete len:203 (+),score=22.48 TRINITY_DN32433_c0_g1_i1:69-677(+)
MGQSLIINAGCKPCHCDKGELDVFSEEINSLHEKESALVTSQYPFHSAGGSVSRLSPIGDTQLLTRPVDLDELRAGRKSAPLPVKHSAGQQRGSTGSFLLTPSTGAMHLPSGAEYRVRIQRPPGTGLGLGVDHHQELPVLPIAEVAPNGPFGQWNATCPPQLQILIGDLIVEVNGVRGDPALMLERCKADSVLNIILLRGSG